MNNVYKIKNLEIRNCLVLAPMEAVTDIPFRLICKKMGADIVYSEFVASEALIRDSVKSYAKLRISDVERPIALQIFGGNIESMVESAKIVERFEPDFIDINYGCWVSKVVKNDAGAALLKNPQKMADMTNSIVNSIKIPVTIKTRIGWDKNSIEIEKVAKLQEEAGASAIAIHCRTREQGISGKADWSWINKVKEHVKNIPIILNGDVASPEDAKRAFDETGCDAVMIGRGAIGNPFIFRTTKQFLENGEIDWKNAIGERIDTCLEHLQLNIEYKGFKRGFTEFRKHYSGYIKGFRNAAHVRQKLVVMESVEEVRDTLLNYMEELLKFESEQNERID
ncbi:MAG: tRNA dihydrouridine synthase DusB [Candidatus Kapabacteria bacterium]|nr:tRNA dihydrouridine synthase DusB [Candidatus Kapabacteria bacterium]